MKSFNKKVINIVGLATVVGAFGVITYQGVRHYADYRVTGSSDDAIIAVSSLVALVLLAAVSLWALTKFLSDSTDETKDTEDEGDGINRDHTDKPDD